MAADNGGRLPENRGGLPASSSQGSAWALGAPVLVGSERFPRIGPIDHLFILRALILHSIRFKYRNNAFGLLMEYFRIIIVVVAHYFLFWIRNKPMPGRIPIEIFVIAAFSVWYAFRDSFKAADGGWKSPAGATLIPGITRMHMRVAKTAWAFLSTIFFCLLATWALNLWGDEVNYPDIVLTTLILFLAAAMGFGYGLIVEALTHVWGVLEPVAHLTLWGIFVTSGIYFSIADKTSKSLMADIFWYNPVLHCTEYQRHSFYSGYPIALVTLLYPAACASGLVFLGLMLDRWFYRLDHE